MQINLSVRTQMKVSPQLVIAGRLLQASGTEIIQMIDRELENNPALELVNDNPGMRSDLAKVSLGYGSGYSVGFISGRDASRLHDLDVENIEYCKSPIEMLTEQISSMVDKADRISIVQILNYLDHRGYLTMQNDELARELELPEETISRFVSIIQQLEPAGIGARNLRECFLMQCEQLELSGLECQSIRAILTHTWDDFLNHRWSHVVNKLHISRDEVEDASKIMRRYFNPTPLTSLESSVDDCGPISYIDLIIQKARGSELPKYKVVIPGAEEYELRLCQSFQNAVVQFSSDKFGISAEDEYWIRGHTIRARTVIDALNKRWNTLKMIGEYVIHHQNDFLEHGSAYLKPITRVTMARDLNLNESTVSRAVKGKVAQVPNGRLIPLGDFFSPSLAPKEAIRSLLKKTKSRVLSDREIAESLATIGFNISRRTVAKYRKEVNIQSSHFR